MITHVKLLKEVTEYDAAGIARKKTIECDAIAELKNIGQREFFSAGQMGMKPEMVADVFLWDYNYQTSLLYNGTKYHVYRTTVHGDYISLYLTKRAKDL